MFCLMHNNDAINVMYEYYKKRMFFLLHLSEYIP